MKAYRILPLLFIFFLLQGCIDIIDNKRIYLEGTITDGDGFPVADVPVVYKMNGFTLGYGFTDTKGQYGFYSLEADAKSEMRLEINRMYDEVRGNYSSVIITDDDEFSFQENDYRKLDITLQKKSTLQFSINHVTNINADLDWDLQYTYTNYYNSCLKVYTDVFTGCYETFQINGTQNSETPHKDISITSFINQEVIFTYQINGGNTETVSIPLTSENVTYEFTY